jgi:hypothetical protein
MDKPFQRKGAKSNTHVGKEFERTAKDFFTLKGLHLQKDISIDIEKSLRDVQKAPVKTGMK